MSFKIAKCIFEGKEYENNAILPKSTDPCVYCRCFYGKEICQEQKCPSPPSLGCVAERIANQCCPVYTCRLGGSNANESTLLERSAAAEPAEKPSHFRKGPQFMTEANHQQSANKLHSMLENRQEESHAKSRFEHSEPNMGALSPSALPLNRQPFGGPHPNQPPRLSFPFDAIGLAYGTRLAEQNRVHFPQKNKHPNNMPANFGVNLLQPNPHLQNPILNLHKPLLNRPLFPSHPPNNNNFNKKPQHHQSHNKPPPPPPVLVDDIRGGHSPPIGSQIRPLPQSPTQLEKNPNTVNESEEESNMNPKPRPPQFAPTEPAAQSAASTTESSSPVQHSSGQQTQPSGPWDILQVSGK